MPWIGFALTVDWLGAEEVTILLVFVWSTGCKFLWCSVYLITILSFFPLIFCLHFTITIIFWIVLLDKFLV
jgi:hypothetical protein